MFLLFIILSKLMPVYYGMMIGAWIAYGYTHIILIGIIMSITLHFICLFMAKYYIKSKNNVHIRELHYGDDKPDEACPDKLEPTSSKDYEDEPC